MSALNDEKIPALLEKLKRGEVVNEDQILSIVTEVVNSCHVPQFERVEDVPYEAVDFLGVAKNAEYHLGVLNRLLQEFLNLQAMEKKFSILFERNLVVMCLLAASEYSDADCEWSSNSVSIIANCVVENICRFVKRDCLEDLLNDGCGASDPKSNNLQESMDLRSDGNYLRYILQTLVKTMTKQSWKTNAASKASYWFILTRVDRKNMTECLPYLLPPALFIVDDWEQRNKILGLKSLQHILQNTTGSELRWYGRAAVIFDAIKTLLYTREIEIIQELYPTIVLAAKVIEADPEHTGQFRKDNSFDIIIKQLIDEMRFEQKIVLRITYASVLPTLLDAMGILVLTWSKDIISVCEDYLATFSGPKAEDRISILKSLQVYIRKSWPQIHVDVASILKMIFRLICDVTDQESGVDDKAKETLISEALQIVRLLMAAAPNITKELVLKVTDTLKTEKRCRDVVEEMCKVVNFE